MWSIPRWAILLLGAALLVFGFAVHMGWLRDPSLAKADYVGNIDVSAEDAKLYRAVPFEWRVTSNAGIVHRQRHRLCPHRPFGRAPDAVRLAAARQGRQLDPRHALAERGPADGRAT